MYHKLRKDICKANKDLVKYNLVISTWGNVSGISDDGKIIAIKPSGVNYDKLTPKDIVLLDLEGNIIWGNKKPSSDTLTHIEIYKKFKGIKSVIHTHSTYATIFAQAKKQIDCLGTTHADYFYGSIPVTRELTKHEINEAYELNTGKVIINHFEKNGLDPLAMPACLVASHGPFVWGKSIISAIENALVLENIAKMKIETRRLNPNINQIERYLLDKHYLRKHGKNAYYGQNK